MFDTLEDTTGLFEMLDENQVLIGDALLPEYTSNSGGAYVRVHNPLRKYDRTLR